MKNYRGLTLIELMVTLAVFAIVTILAFPGFRLYNQNSNRVTQINDMVATINMARSEAVKRSLPVVVCASTDQLTCSGVNDWTTGWITFLDDNLNNAVDATDGDGAINGGEVVLYVHGRLSGANLLFGDVESATRNITFLANGTSNTAATFMRCDDRTNTDAIPSTHARAIILTLSGRTRLARDGADADTILERLTGPNLDCTVPLVP